MCDVMHVSVCLLQCDGTLLATGSYDGYARIWSTDGMLSNFVFLLSLQYNRK